MLHVENNKSVWVCPKITFYLVVFNRIKSPCQTYPVILTNHTIQDRTILVDVCLACLELLDLTLVTELTMKTTRMMRRMTKVREEEGGEEGKTKKAEV